MLKVLAAVLAVLSAAISITIYTAKLPDVQKQAADNAAAIGQNAEAIETLGGSVSDNAQAIETLENKKLYAHYCKFRANGVSLTIQSTSTKVSFITNTFVIINSSSTAFTSNTLGAYYYNNNFDFGGTGKPEYAASGSIKSGSDFSQTFGLVESVWLYVSIPYPGATPSTTVRFGYYIPSLNINSEYTSGISVTFVDKVVEL